MSKILIAPSILAADFGNLAAATQMINESHADYIHIDICLLYTSDAADE